MAPGDLELTILLLQPLKCWDYKHVLSYPAKFYLFFF
jgi:hypothetical protein